jgi:hypothetical protein
MTSCNPLEVRVKDLEETRAVCTFRFGSVSEDVRELRVSIEDLVRAIRGNGHEGLLSRVARNETLVKVTWAVVGTHTVTLIALIGWLITKGI